VDATPELDLLTYSDWIPDDGVGAALAFAHDGLSYDTPVWKGLLSSDAHDHLFTETSADWGTEATIPLATSVVEGFNAQAKVFVPECSTNAGTLPVTYVSGPYPRTSLSCPTTGRF
jgi:hypothetical protein